VHESCPSTSSLVPGVQQFWGGGTWTPASGGASHQTNQVINHLASFAVAESTFGALTPPGHLSPSHPRPSKTCGPPVPIGVVNHAYAANRTEGQSRWARAHRSVGRHTHAASKSVCQCQWTFPQQFGHETRRGNREASMIFAKPTFHHPEARKPPRHHHLSAATARVKSPWWRPRGQSRTGGRPRGCRPRSRGRGGGRPARRPRHRPTGPPRRRPSWAGPGGGHRRDDYRCPHGERAMGHEIADAKISRQPLS